MVYKYFGLLSIVLLIIGLITVIKKWPHNASYSFSQHVAPKKSSILYYAALFFITMPLLVLFIMKWFTPQFGVSRWFGVLTLISAVAQCICTLVPETGGRKSLYHRFFAGLSAIVLIPSSLILLLWSRIDFIDKMLLGLGVVTMLWVVTIVVRSRAQHDNFLILQSVYFASFFVPILYISYL